MDKDTNLTEYKKANKKRIIWAIVGACIIIPLIIYLSFVYLDSSKYLITSILVLVVSMLPFFLVFEKRKPKAREVVIIAVFCAIVILAQMVFHVTIPIQAGSALVVVAGAALGPEAGFMIGALSRFILNFYMGQGPWTPWEMFCWGILGFFAGIVFNRSDKENNENAYEKGSKNKLKDFKLIMGPIVGMFLGILVAYIIFLFDYGNEESFIGWRVYVFGAIGLVGGALVQRKKLSADRITLTIFTIFVTFIFYGGIMNICAMVTASGMPGSNPISWDTLRMLFLTGFPYDLFHAITAGIFVFIFGTPIINKLDRIKTKYGIYQ